MRSVYVRKIIILLIIRVTWQCQLQRSTPDSPTYIGAVVEFQPVSQPQPTTDDFVNLNIAKHKRFIQEAAKHNVDILVFPEGSMSSVTSAASRINSEIPERLVSYIPDPADSIVPCVDGRFASTLRNISCAARNFKMYISLNHYEQATADTKNLNNIVLYNTNVIFDREGRVIARYRKYHLFFEPNISIPEQPEISIFETDFGVRFGHFVCFDLLFKNPALKLITDFHVTDIIFPSHWYSEMPFLYSTEIQAAYAFSNDVNLLASGYNNPSTLSGGSGIYIGRDGPNNLYFSKTQNSNILIVSEIPKMLNGSRQYKVEVDRWKRYYDVDTLETIDSEEKTYLVPYFDFLDPYSTILIDLNKTIHNVDLCKNELCCNFQVEFESSHKITFDYFRHRFAVFKGNRIFGNKKTAGLQVCAIITCEGNELSDCHDLKTGEGRRLSLIGFKSINITMPLETNEASTPMPITLTNSYTPLSVSDYLFGTVGRERNQQKATMNLKISKNNLITFSIYSRIYENDGLPQTLN